MATQLSATASYSYGDIAAIDGATKLTLSLWHYQTAAQNTGVGDGSSVSILTKSGSLIFKDVGGGALPKIWGIGDGAGNNAFTNTNVVADDLWQNFITTYDGTLGAGTRTAIYLNGASLSMNTNASPASWPSNASSVLIGGGVLGAWEGTVAFLIVWAGATLSASEVAQQWNKAVPEVQQASVILYVPMIFGTNPGATYDNAGNALVSTGGTPATGTVGEPPVIWPTGHILPGRNTRRAQGGTRRDRFRRMNPLIPNVLYG